MYYLLGHKDSSFTPSSESMPGKEWFVLDRNTSRQALEDEVLELRKQDYWKSFVIGELL